MGNHILPLPFPCSCPTPGHINYQSGPLPPLCQRAYHGVVGGNVEDKIKELHEGELGRGGQQAFHFKVIQGGRSAALSRINGQRDRNGRRRSERVVAARPIRIQLEQRRLHHAKAPRFL